MSTPKLERLLYIDTESTCLDESQGVLLEVAAAVAPFDSPFDVTHILSTPIAVGFETLRNLTIDPKVRKMHTDNGLFAECLAGDKPTLIEADMLLASKLSPDFIYYTSAFGADHDLRWVAKHMPRTHAMLSYRKLDIRSVEIWMRTLGWDAQSRPSENKPHRAYDDLVESIETSKHYAEQLVHWTSRPAHAKDPIDPTKIFT